MAAPTVFFVSFCVFFLLATEAQVVPPWLCINTGPTCHNDCSTVNNPTISYQWCGGCQFYISCVGAVTHYQPCAATLYWDDNDKRCEAVSNTCRECVIDTTPGDSTATTTQETPPVPPLCTSTGPDCLDDCDVTHNGIYQWCGRCDIFLLCSGSANHYMNCSAGLVYDHTNKTCEYVSSTCFVCYEGLTTPSINPCFSNPCYNGTCVPSDSGFQCLCDIGWTGDRCQTPLFCYSEPCQNGGTCDEPGMRCICPIGFTGPFCQTPLFCYSEPCQNGGTCDEPGMRCICPIGFTGPFCQTPIPCFDNPCLNGGTCVSPNETCICPDEFTGTLCESENYNLNDTCGDLSYTGFNATNNFTRLCYFTAWLNDTVGRATPCSQTVQGIPVYGNGTNLIQAGGNFGCIVATNYPNDLDPLITATCRDNFQHQTSLGALYYYMLVCIRYPY